MKSIKVLGSGCAKCARLYAAADAAAQALGIEHQIEKVTDLQQIMAFGVMSTPALVVDGQVKAAGRVPAEDEIKGWLSAS